MSVMSVIVLFESNFPLIPCMSRVVSSSKFAIAVFMINCNSVCHFCPFPEAVISPTGFPENTVVAIHHSIAFFRPLGILKTYSGVHMITPSAWSIDFRNFCIEIGGLLMESSGSKCGSSFKSWKMVTWNVFSDKRTNFSTSLRFAESELALPMMASILCFVVIVLSVFEYISRSTFQVYMPLRGVQWDDRYLIWRFLLASIFCYHYPRE